jgi:hypothetical protein
MCLYAFLISHFTQIFVFFVSFVVNLLFFAPWRLCVRFSVLWTSHG